jgi:hypothetical protein
MTRKKGKAKKVNELEKINFKSMIRKSEKN